MGLPASFISNATTTSTSVITSGCRLEKIIVVNTTGVIYYLKIFDKASAPTLGTDTPVLNIPLPGNALGAGLPIPVDLDLHKGLAFAITGAIALLDGSNAAVGVAVNFVTAYPRLGA